MPDLNYETIVNESKGKRFFHNRLVITFALLLLLGIFALVLVVIPRINSVKTNIQDLKKRKEELATLTQKLTYLESLDHGQLKIMSDLLINVLPVSNHPGPIIKEIELISRQTNFSLKGINAKPGVIVSESNPEGSGPLSLSYSVSGSASEQEFIEFISQLESTFPLLVAENISFNSLAGSVTAQLNLLSYFSSLPQKIGSVSSPLAEISENEKKLYQHLAKFKDLRPEVDALPSTTVGKENPFL